MSQQLRTYDPGEHIVTFGGIPVTAFATDAFIAGARNEDGWTLTVGASGEPARTRNRNTSGRVTVTLLGSSAENDTLMEAALSDENRGDGVGEFFVKDNAGTGFIHASSAWIVKIPDMNRAKALGVAVWVFELAKMELFTGGNLVTASAL